MVWAHFAGAIEPPDSTWRIEPLEVLNSSADEVLIGWDGQEIYFGRVETAWNLKNDMRWFLESRQDFTARRMQGWSEFERPISTHLKANRFPSWDALGDIQHVAIDPNRGVLVMSVWMEDGQFDLHIAQKEGDSWSTPKPLEALNTPQNEVFPNFNGGDLWFGSDRPGGQGGFDIYRSTRLDLFSKVSLLPVPINSVGDELTAISIGNNSDSNLYISAIRAGGQGGVDLLWMGLPPAKGQTDSVRLGMEIRYQRESIKNLDIHIRERGGRHVFSGALDDQGRVEVGAIRLDAAMEVRLESNKRKKPALPDGVVCHVYKKCPLETCLNSTWPGWKHIRSYRLSGGEVFVFDLLPLDALGNWPRPSDIDRSILDRRNRATWEARFDSNESNLSESDENEFMKWLRSFELTQGQWPENLKLQIEGHTDSEGSSAGNYQLSLQRAQQVLGLASKMGFGAHRMEVFGWGSKFASGEVQEDRRVIVRWVQY
jgi:hypothetical protein